MVILSTEIWTSTEIIENTTIGPTQHSLDFSNLVEILTILATIISIICSLLILWIFKCIVRENKDLVICMVQCLAVVNVAFGIGQIMGITYYVGAVTSDSFCVIQSFICTFSDLVSYWYVAYIIIYAFNVDAGSQWMDNRKAKWVCHSAAWIIPFIITVSAASSGSLGASSTRFGNWCWIKEKSLTNKARLLWMLFTKQAWEISIYFLSSVLIIISIWMKKRKRTKSKQMRPINMDSGDEHSTIDASTRNQSKFKVMVWVLLYFYFTRIWGTIRNMVRIVGLGVGSPVPGFQSLDEHFFIHAQSIGDSFQGIINFGMFCCNKKVWRKVRKMLCCRRQDQNTESPSALLLDHRIENKSYLQA
ncbi:cyclic AMP receptor 4-like [Ylistrum balloti]|uniref:cyclic AMP receptor 4-like n=1 Tax=Ylistrum balloti TaxID=509963 RepID=UPI002905B631|nr:cyclic AMP receptor 4-like [Ylistrum balloti]